MKKVGLIMVGMLALTTLSCGPAHYHGLVKANAMGRNEIRLTDDLKMLLKNKSAYQVVVRLPHPSGGAGEAEEWGRYREIIEKVFEENGFAVFRQALPEDLMKVEDADYRKILEKHHVDLLVDVTGLEFNVPNKVFKYIRASNQPEEPLPASDNYVDCSLARMGCRLILVANAKSGGSFNLFTSRCDLEQLEIFVDKKGYMCWVKDEGKPTHKSLIAPMETEEQRQRAVKILALRMVLKLKDTARQ